MLGHPPYGFESYSSFYPEFHDLKEYRTPCPSHLPRFCTKSPYSENPFVRRFGPRTMSLDYWILSRTIDCELPGHGFISGISQINPDATIVNESILY